MKNLGLLILLGALPAAAQDAPKPEVQRDQVDFFGDGPVGPVRKPTAEPPESLWAEPVRMPDGRFSVYVPPPAVLTFLTKPDRESARAYLTWQRERMKRLQDALEILEEVQREEALGKGREQAPDPAPALPVLKPLEILYFKRPDCPWCAKQDEVLVALARTRPDVAVRVAAADGPEAKALGVTLAPTLIVTDAGGKPHRLEGFTPAQRILGLLSKEVSREAK